LRSLCCFYAVVHYERDGYWGETEQRREQLRKTAGMEAMNRIYRDLREKYEAGYPLPTLDHIMDKVLPNRRQRVGKAQ
jgi:hypothetical protein